MFEKFCFDRILGEQCSFPGKFCADQRKFRRLAILVGKFIGEKSPIHCKRAVIHNSLDI
jgi:hypothetical protein